MTALTRETMPAGQYAIVEAMGHRTIIGRISEVERFGTTMLQIEPVYADALLEPILLGGASIFQLTPCSPETAFDRRPTSMWNIPASIRAIVPPLMIAAEQEGDETDWLPSDSESGFVAEGGAA